jgi:hypothetical protein
MVTCRTYFRMWGIFSMLFLYKCCWNIKTVILNYKVTNDGIEVILWTIYIKIGSLNNHGRRYVLASVKMSVWVVMICIDWVSLRQIYFLLAAVASDAGNILTHCTLLIIYWPKYWWPPAPIWPNVIAGCFAFCSTANTQDSLLADSGPDIGRCSGVTYPDPVHHCQGGILHSHVMKLWTYCWKINVIKCTLAHMEYKQWIARCISFWLARQGSEFMQL